MKLLTCSFILVAAFFGASPAQNVREYLAAFTPNSSFLLPVLQTHMPTRHGDVPHLQTQEQPVPMDQAKTKLDAAQLQSEARELLELSQSLQSDIESVNHGVLPKDTIEKLKRIQKLAKHLRGEIEPWSIPKNAQQVFCKPIPNSATMAAIKDLDARNTRWLRTWECGMISASLSTSRLVWFGERDDARSFV